MPKKTTETEEKSQNVTEETTQEMPNKCDTDAIIRYYTYGAVGIGFVPIPLVDLAGLTALQLKMIHSLSKAYGVEFRKKRTKAIISALCGGVLSTGAVPVFFSLFKAVPVVGQTMGAATTSITGGAATYALGRVFNRHFREGGTLLNMSSSKMKDGFSEYYQKGEKAIKDKLSKKKEEETSTATA